MSASESLVAFASSRDELHPALGCQVFDIEARAAIESVIARYCCQQEYDGIGPFYRQNTVRICEYASAFEENLQLSLEPHALSILVVIIDDRVISSVEVRVYVLRTSANHADTVRTKSSRSELKRTVLFDGQRDCPRFVAR